MMVFPVTQQISIKIDGTALAESVIDMLVLLEVESSLYVPDMFIMRFIDDAGLTLIDGGTLALGKSVEIQLGDATNQLVTVFNGEITALEPDFGADASIYLTVRGYDKRHRLNRASKTASYLNQKASDIVTSLAGSAGLSTSVEATTIVYDHIVQHNQTDLAFIHQLAHAHGYEVSVDGSTLKFRKMSTTSRASVTLAWKTELRSFKPRLSLAGQVNQVTVRGWNDKTKQAIVGTKSSTTYTPAVSVGGTGGSLAQSKFGAATQIVVRRPVRSQSEADALAQSLLDEINAGYLEAEGTAYGNPHIVAGKKVTLSNLGTKFSGTYVVTSARHIYAVGELYETEFHVSGASPQLLAGLLEQQAWGSSDGRAVWNGVVVALVTNNKDPENRGRVKVKFPWLNDSLESDWARVCAVGAGATRGIQWIPEVNDEVIVAFEHGDFDYPYVVGSVWNGTDAVPQNPQVDQNGNVEIRKIRTRVGHHLTFYDKQGEQKIEIIDAASATKIIMDTTTKKITVQSTGEILVKAGTNMNLEATGTMTIKGATINVEASGSFTQKANGTGTVQAGGPLTIKGAVVNIN